MAYLLAGLLGLAFGAGDQYLGSMSWLGPWTSTVAQVSAPWLIIAFVAGTTQPRARRAMLVGVVATAAALIGYFAMTYSPMEVPEWTFGRFTSGVVAIATTGYNPAYILGGVTMAPLFGLLGQQWRVRRWWVSVPAVAGVLCLEPIARWATGQIPYTAPSVWAFEVAVGAVVAAVFTLAILARRAPSDTG
ncbi:MAG: hypothetical protein ABI828_00765 [Actinomycetota bacterium]